MSLLRSHAPKALPPASLHSGSTTSRTTNIRRWAFHPQPQGPSITRTFISPSQQHRSTNSPPRRSSQPYRGRPQPQRQEPPPVRNGNRSLIITGLDYDVTVTELLQSIARTAPVGAISSALLLAPQPRHARPPNPRSRWPPNRGDMLAAGAKVSFNRRTAAMELVRLARDKVFRVRDRTPLVTEDRKRYAAALANNDNGVGVPVPPLSQYVQTRVLVLEGPLLLDGFDEAAIRQLLRSDAAAMRDAGPFGDLSEPVITKDLRNGKRRMEWRFFSYSSQALPFKKVIRSHFSNRLSVRHGRDPCCPVNVWEEERSRTRGRAKGEANLSSKKARWSQSNHEIPIDVPGQKRDSRSHECPTAALELATEYFPEEGWEIGPESPISASQPTTEHITKGRHLDNAAVALKIASKLFTETKADQGWDHVWSEDLEDRTVVRQSEAKQTTETVAVESRELVWKEEQVADGPVTRETNVEQAVEADALEHDREHIGNEDDLESVLVALDITAEQSTRAHAQQGTEHIQEEGNLEVGPVSQDITAKQTAEVITDRLQDRKDNDEGKHVINEQHSLQLVRMEAT